MDTVQTMYQEVTSLDEYLLAQEQISLRSSADSSLKKSLLLASASYFEKEIVKIISDYAEHVSSGSERLTTFVQKKALARQYHTLFDWKSGNCNQLLSLFGPKFKDKFKQEIDNSDVLKQSIKDFIEIGAERNRMVHTDFGQYYLEKTAEEIFVLHENAKNFCLKLRDELFSVEA